MNTTHHYHPITYFILAFAITWISGYMLIIMNYLFYKNGRSIFLLALFHIIVNFSYELFEANQISKCILTLILTGVAVVLVARNKEFFFQNEPMAKRSQARLTVG